MKGLLGGWLLAAVVVLGSGCSDRCRNPKRIVFQGREGNAVQCNAVVTCPGYGGRPDMTKRLEGLDDPMIVDRGSVAWNRDGCIDQVKKKDLCELAKISVSPTMICLDASGAPDGSGPDVTGSTGGTLVTVGVCAGTGDYWISEDGAGGAGGAGGFSAEPGEEGQGGI